MAARALPLVAELVATLGKHFVDNLDAGAIVIQQPSAGAFWISSLDGNWGTWKGQVVSCYYHPTLPHTATTQGKLGLKKSEAKAGHWAISYQTRAMMGNKTWYSP